ncbi:hypothetical protein AMJ50_02085 [Parcubacteria bacterium DG_74_3]|nr:MAG: hypothetical protein AMJ50_02085 [Parcubacteria bacterium DG_74_3]
MSGRKPDYILLGVSLILIAFGILILSSASASISQERFGQSYYFLNHQLLFGLLPGVILGFLAFKIELSFLKKQAPILILINLFLMLMVFLPWTGSSFRGGTRWLTLGPISFQPSEFLKLGAIIYWASWLTSPKKDLFLSRKKTKTQNFLLIPFLIITGLIGLLLIFQPDISTLGIIVFVSTLIYFWADTPFWHTVFIILIGLACLFALVKLAPYRLSRFSVFFNPDIEPMGIGYQIKQALITIGSGRISGVGLGLSRQKSGFLPQSMSDSIFAILAEETGFLGGATLIFLFLIFLWRSFKVALSNKDAFSQLLGAGISSWIILQAFINIGSMIGIIPLTGIPLPFVSYGGSALTNELIGLGLLLNISKQG